MLSPDDLNTAIGGFSSATRLYAISFKDESLDLGDMLVEAFLAIDELQTVGARDIIVLSSNGNLDLDALLGKQASLLVTLADGSRASFTGLIHQAEMLGSSADLVRYRLRLSSSLWRLGRTRNSRVWTDKSVVEIVEAVLGDHRSTIDWRWTKDALEFLRSTAPRRFCAQYRETDLGFIMRLLTAEGVAWRVEESEESAGGHRIVFFADSRQASACPEDPTSAASNGGAGIRFHGARATEEQDAIQGLMAATSIGAASVAVLSYDYTAKKIIAASVPTNQPIGGKNAPLLEQFDSPGECAFAQEDEATHYASLQIEALEARNRRWMGRSTVRTLRAGTRLTLTQGPLERHRNQLPEYVVVRVVSAGLNNLPKPAAESLAELFGPIPELLEESVESLGAFGTVDPHGRTGLGYRDTLLPDRRHYAPAGLVAQVVATGYANHFEMLDAALPWRPVLEDGTGTRRNPRTTAMGSQSAIVVGAGGEGQPSGADEICVDAMGRVRIRFHWQDEGDAACWVRVAQRSAGAGMGAQFIPRIGQEVLVQFMEGNIDRPVVVGALYNGQGEGGVMPTPGGNCEREADLSVFERANDHAISGQGNLAGGNSPAWHGAASGNTGHRNGAALSGVRSKEFGGTGYNQLVFDDTDDQGSIQLKSSYGASELNLGHLIHRADNYRGSFRGLGAELRTDACGAVRAGRGLLISSYGIGHSSQRRDPAGENAPALANLKQAVQLASSFSSAASAHRSVALASHIGSARPDASKIDGQAAPLRALLTAAGGMLSQDSLDGALADAAGKQTESGDGKLPHSTDAIIGIAARAGLGVAAGQAVQLAIGETATFMSGQDSQFVSGGRMRLHTGQAIGVLGGAVKPGENSLGVQLIAAKDAIAIVANSDAVNVQARDEINVISANAHVDWAAAKSIRLATAGGASITIAGGTITVECPGKLTIQAGKKSFVGPERLAYPLPKLPGAFCLECLLKAMKAGSAFAVKS
jgi:Rhs element Vgr protein